MSVTLLFTDIEGSTRLVQALGDGYPAALERHRVAVRGAFAAHRGEEIDCRGDEFSIAFGDPGQAVAAAEAIQQARVGDIRVRIGIHTGEPIRIEGGYVGLDVHRAARICAAGHGGQVLLSQATVGLLGGGATVRDLGEHQLRGVDEPVRLHQLGASDFPALRADAADVGLGARTRIVLADDSVLLREGIARLLEDAGFEIVGQAGNADELMLKVRSYSPDVAIVDIRLPPTHSDEGLQAALEIRAQHPSVGVLVLSQYVEVGLAMKLLADSAEGVGYLLKNRINNVKDFLGAVRRVAAGGTAIDPIIISTLLTKRRSDDPLAQLTPREREILVLMAEGRSNQGIADKLVITLRAVERHVSTIFGKLGLPSTGTESRRVLAVLLYLRS